jgi:hypothetical protein
MSLEAGLVGYDTPSSPDRVVAGMVDVVSIEWLRQSIVSDYISCDQAFDQLDDRDLVSS